MLCRSCRGNKEEEKWEKEKGNLDNSVEKRRRERKGERGVGRQYKRGRGGGGRKKR